MAGLPTVTLANHTSILTGRLPGHHGILHNAWFDRAPRRAGDHQLPGHVAVGDGPPHAGGRVPARRHPPRPARRVHRVGERALRPRCRLLDLRLLPPRRGAADPRVTRGAAAHHRAVRAPVEGLLVVVGGRPHGRRAGRRHLGGSTTATCRSRRRRSCGATSPSPTPRSTRGARSRRSRRRRCATPTRRVGEVLDGGRARRRVRRHRVRARRRPRHAGDRPRGAAATGTSSCATPASSSATRATASSISTEPVPELDGLADGLADAERDRARRPRRSAPCASPARPAWRPVKIDVAAPTPNSATTESTAATTVGAAPLPNRNGITGKSGARARRRRTTRSPPTHGEPSVLGIEPELLPRQRVERDVVAAHDRVDQRARGVGRDALGPVDHLELVTLLRRERAQLLLLDAQLVLVELALRPDRDPLPRRHRERTGDQPGDAGEQHDAVVGWSRRRRPSPARSSTPGRR